IAVEPLVGGALHHVQCLLDHTDAEEFDLHLAASAERDPSVRQRFRAWRKAGRRVHEVPMVRRIAPHRDAVAFERLLALCRGERFDVVHTHCAKAGFLGRLAGRLTGAATVHTPHVLPFGRGGGVAAEAVYLGLERLAGRWTDRLVLLSRYQQNLVLCHRLVPYERTVVIPNGIEPGAPGRLTKAQARRQLGLARNERVVLAAGRLCEQKGYDVLLDAVGHALGGGASLRVLIAGDGPLREELSERVRRQGLGQAVRLLGRVADLGPLYAACDLVAMPSRFEGMPYTMLQAQAAARPVAVSLVSGMEEFVGHGRDGFLLAPAAVEAWARLLVELAGMRGLLREMGRRARSRLKTRWPASRCVGELHGLYRLLAEAKREERSREGLPGHSDE
ncbi:MAG: hypothetical protein AMK73_08050, partial [Planctomycetes bacterium SM23_32]